MNIQPCIDCRKCADGMFECSIKDDMTKLYAKLDATDVLVFGTPLYWYGPSAQMKLVMDRLLPYGMSKKLGGKKAILVVPSEEGAETSRHLVGMFELSFKYLEVQIVNKLLVKANKKGEVKEQLAILRNAFAVGKSLAK